MNHTSKNLVIYYQVQNDIIMKTKNWLFEEYENKYNQPPHITVLIMPIPEDHITQCFAAVEKEISAIKPFTVNLNELEVEERPSHLFYYLNVNDQRIRDLHVHFTKVAGQFRRNYLRTKDIDRLTTDYYTNNEKKMIEQYGYARSGEEFDAHITIGEIDRSVYPVNPKEVVTTLRTMLSGLQLKQIVIDNLELVYGTEDENEPNKLRETVYLR